MADILYDDLASTAGQNTGNYLRDTANAIAGGICSLYQNYPWAVVNNLDATNISTRFGNGLMNSLCAPRGQLPSPPSTQAFTGGQCVTVYTVYATLVKVDPSGNNPQTLSNVYLGTYRGPISNIGLGAPSGSTPNSAVRIDYNPTDASLTPYFPSGIGGGFYYSSISNIQVTRTDGQADNCGNPNPDFPIVVPPPSVYNFNVSVVQPTGWPSLVVPIALGFAYGQLNATAQIKPNVSIGFDLGGVTLKFPGKNGTPTDTTNDPRIGQIQTTVNNVNNNVNNLQTTANNIKNDTSSLVSTTGNINRRVDPPTNVADTSKYTPVTTANANTKKVTGKTHLFSVRITITQRPINSTSIDGGSVGIRTFGGYFTWTTGAVPGEKVQINWLDNEYLAPVGVDGYALALETGWLATVTEYYANS